jgi:hypothetical protein
MKRLIVLGLVVIACGGSESVPEPEPEFDPCMPNAQNKTLRLYGPWGGLQDHETDTTSVDFARSFNVEIDGREIRSRRGRVPYGTAIKRTCPSVVMGAPNNPSPFYVDVTGDVGDGLPSTMAEFVADPPDHPAQSRLLFIGFPTKVSAIAFTLHTANLNSGGTVEAFYDYWDGANLYDRQVTVVDGTAGMTVDGTVSWADAELDDWKPGLWTTHMTSDSVPDFDQTLYWLRVRLRAYGEPSTFPTRTLISEIRVVPSAPEYAPVGMIQSGTDLVITSAGGVIDVRSPNDATNVSYSGEGTGRRGWLVAWGDALVGASGRSPVVYDDGAIKPLKAVPGIDAATTGYLSSLPDAQALAVYRGRLYLAHGKTVIFSELNNALNIIPYDGSAPQRGANVWPASNNFDASGEIAGFAVFGDRLVIATDVGLDVWDGHSRQSVPGAPGCVAGHTIAETRKGLAYLALDGVYLFNGASARHISGGVSETLERVSKNAVHGAVGVAYPAARQYRLYVPVNGSARNTLCLAWNYEDDRWFPLGGTPPWLDADERYREMEVAAACVANVGADGEVLLTADYDGNVWVEDRGFTDGGYTISWVLAFKRLGLGEDEGMRTWRNVRISAKATGAPIKLAMLPDGDDLEMSILAGTETGMPVAGAVATLTEGQATWMMDAPGPEPLPDEMSLDLEGAVERDASGGSSPTSVWRSFPVPHARVTRTIQPVLYCDGVDSTGARRGTKAAVRGIEVDYRIRTGRRSLA